jgi:hypothetical protein
MKKRFTLLIGALGSDTTALFRHLGAHPQVLPCRVAEPRFFTDDRKWALGVEFYRSLWEFREPDERVAIEASSDYALHPAVPCPAERIAQLPTGFRFVYLLRHPLERIEWHHCLELEAGRVRRPLAEGVPQQMVDASRYATQLEAYRTWFPAEDFLLLAQEDLARDPAAALRRVCSFLEIDPYFGFPGLEQGEAGQLPPAARRGLLERLRRRPAPAPRRREPPRLSPEQRGDLLAELSGDLERLRAEWGFDVSRWLLA